MSAAEKKENRSTPPVRFKGFDGSWEEKRLKNFCNFSKGKGYSKADVCESGTPLFLYGRMYTDYEAEVSAVDTFCRPNAGSVYSTGNEVVCPASGETAEDIARASAVVSKGIVLGGDLNILTPGDDINTLFLALALSNGSISEEIATRAQGKTVVHIHNSDLEDVKVLYPSLPEQQKIGAAFRSLDGLIAGREKALEKLKELKKAMLIKMFPQRGAKVPEVRFKGFDGAWEEKRLGKVCSITTGHRDVNEGCETGAYPFFTCSRDVFLANTYSFDDEAILIAGNGDVGNLHYYNGKFEAYQRTYVLTRFEVDVGYLLQYLEAFLIKKLNDGKYGSSMPYIVQSQLSEFNISFPDNLEQRKIGAYFRSLDGLIAGRREEVEKLKQMKKALLDRMFA